MKKLRCYIWGHNPVESEPDGWHVFCQTCGCDIWTPRAGAAVIPFSLNFHDHLDRIRFLIWFHLRYRKHENQDDIPF